MSRSGSWKTRGSPARSSNATRPTFPVRILMDTEANVSNPRNTRAAAEFRAAGIPDARERRERHPALEDDALRRPGHRRVQRRELQLRCVGLLGRPGTNYVDEAIYFTNDSTVVNSFRTKFDDLWTNTTQYANYANVTGPLMRRYSAFPEGPRAQLPAARVVLSTARCRSTTPNPRRSTSRSTASPTSATPTR